MMYANRESFVMETPARRRGKPVRLLILSLHCGHRLTWPAVAADIPGAATWVELRANRHESTCLAKEAS